jgi:hypothetical protein
VAEAEWADAAELGCGVIPIRTGKKADCESVCPGLGLAQVTGMADPSVGPSRVVEPLCPTLQDIEQGGAQSRACASSHDLARVPQAESAAPHRPDEPVLAKTFDEREEDPPANGGFDEIAGDA